MSEKIVFVVLTIILFTIVAVCIKSLKKQGLWYDLKSSFMVNIFPLIIGITMGIIVFIILNVVL